MSLGSSDLHPARLAKVQGVLDLGPARSGQVGEVAEGPRDPQAAVQPAQRQRPPVERLVERAGDPAVREIILALNATVDGQTTAHYVTDLLRHLPIRVTRLAHGVPVGGELDYLDEGTLAAAMRQRTVI